MINRFSSLYAGHIDLGDLGQDATPANDRRYSNEELAGVFAKTENMAIAMAILAIQVSTAIQRAPTHHAVVVHATVLLLLAVTSSDAVSGSSHLDNLQVEVSGTCDQRAVLNISWNSKLMLMI